jgi:dipeptidyl aminopeptidase/acylaminoacyl peptidase
MESLRRLGAGICIGIALGTPVAAVLAGDNALHIRERPKASRVVADHLAYETGAGWQPVSIAAADGTPLDAWLFQPAHPNGAAVILLHGVGDSRAGMTSEAEFLLRAGYTALLPDVRGHGASGGDVITYGIREAEDVHRWDGWLLANAGIERLYGLGESMGAAILLQSLACEPRFRAVVAESAFADFPEVAYDRLAQEVGAPRPLFWPIVKGGLLYERLRYGVDLRRASPASVVRATRVPILLIHGTEDRNIPIRHSRELHALNLRATVLWEVPGGHHVDGLATAGPEYIERVLHWFASH